jgi:hypothetical protein
MSKQSKKRPEQYKKDLAKTVISSRVSQKCKDTFEWAAKANDMGVSELVSGVLEDYAEWLLTEYTKEGRKLAEKFR